MSDATNEKRDANDKGICCPQLVNENKKSMAEKFELREEINPLLVLWTHTILRHKHQVHSLPTTCGHR